MALEDMKDIIEKDSENCNLYVQQSTCKRKCIVELENSTKRQKLGLDAPNPTAPKLTEYMVTACSRCPSFCTPSCQLHISCCFGYLPRW
jgi:hypothetical protein